MSVQKIPLALTLLSSLLLLPSASLWARSAADKKPLQLKTADAQTEVVRSQRFDLYIAGQPAGQLVSRDLRNSEGHIELLRESHMHLRRGEMELKINSQSLTVLNASGQALRFSSRRDDATGTMRIRGVIQNKAGRRSVQVVTEAGGAQISRDIVMPQNSALGAELEWRSRQKLIAGAHFKGQVLLEEMGALVDANYMIKKTATGFVIESTTAGIQQRETLDQKGQTVRIDIPSLNAYALPSGSSAPPPGVSLDVLARTVWKAPADMPARQRLRSVLFRVDGDLPNPIPQGRYQRLLENKGRILVQVQRQAKGKAERLRPADRQRFLAATPYEAVQDPRIMAAAKEARAGAKKPAVIVERLTQYVFERISVKDLSRAYAPATVTLQTRTGDCTEHSVLFSALAKASGLPTRLIDGVVVADGQIGYHEWVEVYLHGEGWRPVDPTFGEAVAGPNRLKLAQGTSQPEDLMRMGLSAASALRGLKISVIGHTP